MPLHTFDLRSVIAFDGLNYIVAITPNHFQSVTWSIYGLTVQTIYTQVMTFTHRSYGRIRIKCDLLSR